MTDSKEDQIDLRTLVPGFRLDWSGLRNRFEDELTRFEKLTSPMTNSPTESLVARPRPSPSSSPSSKP